MQRWIVLPRIAAAVLGVRLFCAKAGLVAIAAGTPALRHRTSGDEAVSIGQGYRGLACMDWPAFIQEFPESAGVTSVHTGDGDCFFQQTCNGTAGLLHQIAKQMHWRNGQSGRTKRQGRFPNRQRDQMDGHRRRMNGQIDWTNRQSRRISGQMRRMDRQIARTSSQSRRTSRQSRRTTGQHGRPNRQCGWPSVQHGWRSRQQARTGAQHDCPVRQRRWPNGQCRRPTGHCHKPSSASRPNTGEHA